MGKYPWKIEGLVLRAYRIWSAQRKRAKVEYTFLEFYPWWKKNFLSKKWKRPHVARKIWNGPYAFHNVEMQEQAENNKERNARRGNPGCTHRSVFSFDIKTGKKIRRFKSKREAARFYSVDEKTVYNHAQKITRAPFKFGPKKYTCLVGFKWST